MKNKTETSETIQTNPQGAVQGDVPILRIETLTEGGKLTKNRIVAFGETTGHPHQIKGLVECYEVPRRIGDNLFPGLEIVVIEPATIEHNSGGEHYTIEMVPGRYFIPGPGFQQVEYDGVNERRVAD